MQKKTTWGQWDLKSDNWTLVHRGDGYAIDLERITDVSEVLDWLCHINEKETMTHDDVGNLVKAFAEIFYHLPSTFKAGNTPDVKKILEAYVRPSA
jgi:hypothetical protein